MLKYKKKKCTHCIFYSSLRKQMTFITVDELIWFLDIILCLCRTVFYNWLNYLFKDATFVFGKTVMRLHFNKACNLDCQFDVSLVSKHFMENGDEFCVLN